MIGEVLYTKFKGQRKYVSASTVVTDFTSVYESSSGVVDPDFVFEFLAPIAGPLVVASDNNDGMAAIKIQCGPSDQRSLYFLRETEGELASFDPPATLQNSTIGDRSIEFDSTATEVGEILSDAVSLMKARALDHDPDCHWVVRKIAFSLPISFSNSYVLSLKRFKLKTAVWELSSKSSQQSLAIITTIDIPADMYSDLDF